MVRYLIGFFLTLFSLCAEEEKPFIVMHSRNCGMFSNLIGVLEVIDCYEKNLCSGIEVRFGKEGLYYDENHGENWWEYYFEPIYIGCGSSETYFLGHGGWLEHITTRHKAWKLIEKYIHVKPFIIDRVAQFEMENLEGNFVISMHYRGTDKFHHEALAVSYAVAADQVDRVIMENGCQNYRIFIATDEQSFLDYMMEKYGKMVCFIEARRSSNGAPLHLEANDPYQQGLEALMDAILLSRGDYLIRTSSNLSRWSTWLNPDLPVYELSQRRSK